jgi:hypothetical protein
MSAHYTGGCACGALRYDIADEPVFSNHCQCRDCQHASGTGHASYLTFPARERVALTGEAREWKVAADSGNVKHQGFCPTCGSPVYLTFAAMPAVFTINAASLDDPARFKPQLVTYGVRALPWDTLDPAVPVVDKMPSM